MPSLSADDRFEGLIVNGRIDFKTERTQLSGNRVDDQPLAQSVTRERPGLEPRKGDGRGMPIVQRNSLFRWNPVAEAYAAHHLTQQDEAAFAQHLTECDLCSEDVEARNNGGSNPDLRNRGRAFCRFSRVMQPEDVEVLLRELKRKSEPGRGAQKPSELHAGSRRHA